MRRPWSTESEMFKVIPMPPRYRAPASENHRQPFLPGFRRVDGACFGAYGEGYVRFSYANSFEKLMDAVDRIKKFMASRK